MVTEPWGECFIFINVCKYDVTYCTDELCMFQLLLRTVDMSTVLPEEKEPAVVPEPDITNAQNVDEAAAMESESQASQGMNGGNSGGGNDSSKPGNENSRMSTNPTKYNMFLN